MSGSTNAGEAFDLPYPPRRRKHLCRHRAPGRRSAALQGADVATCRSLCDSLSRGHRADRRRRLVFHRRSGPRGRRSRHCYAVSAYSRGTGRHRFWPFPGGATWHSDQGGKAIEALAHISSLVLDKTGTLTDGRAKVVAVNVSADADPAEVLRLAASLDQASKHIIAQTIVAEAQNRRLKLAIPSDVVETPGEGSMASLKGDPSRLAGSSS